MEIDLPEDGKGTKSDVLRKLSSKGPLPTSVAKLSGSSRVIPSQKDFHFYNNFEEFKAPIAEIDEKSKTVLSNIGASENLLGKPILMPDDKEAELDDDLAFDWLVNVNDEIYERCDVSLDEFMRIRKKEEESGVRTMRVDEEDEENGFQMVYGKKNKKLVAAERNAEGAAKGVQEVKVAAKVKPKVPFHIPTIPRPQDEYRIIVNNSNQPFEHVWLERSEDESRVVHPLEKLSVLDFVDTSDSTSKPEKPLPLEVTPFKLVEEVKDLKQMAIKLRSVNEFAVDLEHNQYRSFQGLTCLMQISTRTEDFVIDTLKLRIHIGPYLRELFKDPTKRKVMHGANHDILWLERDFGIYVCNMFDTGQASRVLKMERYSLEHLLNHFCGVEANKQYQNADWRIRPLPHEMIKYAREDTHYLLYIYDLMRIRLLQSTAESESSDPPLIEVYKRSYDICLQLYEKELLTDTSYLYIYGMQDAELNAQQLAVVSGLCEWRDGVARAEDESTGYVLPNRTLIEIAKLMPLTTNQLRRALKTKHPYIERNLGSVVSIIRHSLQNAAAFEETCKYLKERRSELLQLREASTLAAEESDVLPSEAPEISKIAEELKSVQGSSLPRNLAVENSLASLRHKYESHNLENSKVKIADNRPEISHSSPRNKVNEKGKMDGGDSKSSHTTTSSSHPVEATVEILKKPSRFGLSFGNSAKRKFDPDKREKEDSKLEQMKSTVSPPFRPFSGGDEKPPAEVEEVTKTSEVADQETPSQTPSPPATESTLVDIVVLDDDSDTEQEDEPMSVSDLSSSLQKCFPSPDRAMSSKVAEKSQPSEATALKIQPFDYEAARKEVKFGKTQAPAADGEGRRERRKGSGSAVAKEDGTNEHPQGRRRQAFPASGNRSATFR